MNAEADAQDKKNPFLGMKTNENNFNLRDIKEIIILEEDEEEEKEEFQTCRNSICSTSNKDYFTEESHKRCNGENFLKNFKLHKIRSFFRNRHDPKKFE